MKRTKPEIIGIIGYPLNTTESRYVTFDGQIVRLHYIGKKGKMLHSDFERSISDIESRDICLHRSILNCIKKSIGG